MLFEDSQVISMTKINITTKVLVELTYFCEVSTSKSCFVMENTLYRPMISHQTAHSHYTEHRPAVKEEWASNVYHRGSRDF